MGRTALLSLAAIDAEFVGSGGRWYEGSHALVQQQCMVPAASQGAALLWADARFSARFAPCIQTTLVHLAQAQTRIDCLA